MILFELEIAPGSVVIESGTGSGSLSHALLRALKPTGHLHTFDFHEVRANQARDEFQRHGLGDFVTVYHRDVCALGFTEELNGKADAVFLDLPAPHLAVPHALRTLKDEGKCRKNFFLFLVFACAQIALKEFHAVQLKGCVDMNGETRHFVIMSMLSRFKFVMLKSC